MNPMTIPQKPRRLARLASLLVMAASLVALTGWAADIAFFRGVLPGLSPMMPNTAVAFALAGWALCLLCREPAGAAARWGGRAAAGTAALIGTLTLAEYLFGWDPGIDRLVFPGSVQALGAAFTGRPSILAAINFMLLGTALALLDVRSAAGRRVVDLLVAVPVQISLLAVVGYAGGITSFYAWNSLFPNSPMSLFAAVAFIVLGLGTLCARPDQGLMRVIVGDSAGSLVARRLILAPVAIPLLTGLVGSAFRRAGHLDPEFGGWVSSFLNIVIFVLAIWWVAILLHRAEEARKEAERALRDAKDLLETRVEERTAELAKANARLQASEGRLRLVTDNARVGLVMVDRERRYTFANSAYAGILGLPSTDLVGRRVADVLAGVYEGRIRPDLDRAFAGERVAYELQRTVDGEERHDAVRYEPAETVEGAVTLVVVAITDITESKRAEIASLRLAAIVASSDDAIIGKDLDGVVTSWNRGAQRVFGYTAAEMVGTPILRLIPADRQDEELLILAKVRSGESVEHFETLRQTRDGQLIDVSVTASPIRNAAGTVIGVSKVARDITGRKRAEMALRETSARLSAIFEHSPIAIWDEDFSAVARHFDRLRAEGVQDFRAHFTAHPEDAVRCAGLVRVRDVNQRTVTMFHAADKESVILNLPAYFTGDSMAVFREELAVLAEGGTTFEGEIPLRVPSLGARTLFLTLAVVPGHERTLSRVLFSFHDITGRKQAEEALRESEARLRQIIDLVPVYIFAKDSDGRFLLANRTFSAAYGRTPAEVEGRTQVELSPVGTEALAYLEADRAVIDGGQPLFVPEEPFTTPRGDIRILQTTKIPFALPRTPQPVVLGASVDITELKRVEGEVRRLNEGLEERIRERTFQLEEANRELEAFSYSVSHDLRAPLRAVDGFSQAVIEDYGPALPPEGQRFLQVIRAGAQRMGALIDDLLGFSRLARVPLARRPVDTGRLVREALEELAPLREGRNIELRVGPLPACEGDPALLKQVWLNLLSNALKYSRRRDPAMIEMGCRTADGETAYFVRDNGAGFDMRYAGKLFGVFQRLHRAEEYEGTGVGLAIVQRVVQRHGGRVWADSAVDQGATFWFVLSGVPASELDRH
jgi:PAS domain S-box-containing protein